MTTTLPAGWKLVPEVPTEDMHIAAVRMAIKCTGNDDFPPRVYAAMLAAAPAAPGVSTVAQDELSVTHGMTLGERIAHVGGRTNAQGYIEFGSPMAVNALIQHVLRDIDCTRQKDDGAYQARYRLPGGRWSSWGHVVCGVMGHEQELRYLPAERRPAPAAGDARDLTDLLTRARQSVNYHQGMQRDDTDHASRLRNLLTEIDAAIAAQRQGDAA